MKKINKKLSLNRETLATLSPDLLDQVNGGQAAITGPIVRTVTKYICPKVSELLTCKCLPGQGGGQGPQAGGEGQ